MSALVWLSIFLPGHLYEWWVERAFSAGVLLFACLLMLLRRASPRARRFSLQAGMLFFLIQFLYTASYVYSVGVRGIDTGLRDYFELARYLILWGFVVCVIRHFDEPARRAVERAAAASLYFALFVLACFVFTVPVLTDLFKHRIYADTKTFVDYGILRLAAPFENPNFLGFYAVEVLAFMLFFARSRLRLLHAGAALLVLGFTGSRTAWAGASIVLCAALAVYAYLGSLRASMRHAAQLCLALFVLILVGTHYSQRILQSSRVNRVVYAAQRGGIQNEANAAHRLEQARYALEFIRQSPWLGWGPSKYETMVYVDNQYLLWLLRSGIVGTAFILAALALGILRFLSSMEGDVLAFVGAVAFVLAVALMLLAGQFLDNFRLFFLTVFLMAAMKPEER